MAAYLAAHFGPDIQLAELQDRDNTFLLAHMQAELVGYAKLRDNSALGLPPARTRPAASKLSGCMCATTGRAPAWARP
jgi:hypothetical protein